MKIPSGLLSALSQEDTLFVKHILDLYELSEKRAMPMFSAFMDMGRRSVCEDVLSALKLNGCFYGGFEDAERTVLGFYPDFLEPEFSDFPIKCVKFSFRKADKLSHRDILGSLMAMQIKREMVGDIIISEGCAEAMVYDTIAYEAEGICKIGRVGVSASLIDAPDMIPERNFRIISGTVPSMRIDCIAALAMNVSREKASAALRAEKIMLNYRIASDNDKAVSKGDILSVRGYGKFRIGEIGGETKKGRIHLTIEKYE